MQSTCGLPEFYSLLLCFISFQLLNYCIKIHFLGDNVKVLSCRLIETIDNRKDFRMKRSSTASGVVLLLALLCTTSYGQVTLTGVVTDSLTREHLVGANVLVVGTSLGSAADVAER